MNSLYLSRSRRGVASLIGGVILILIILSGFAFYTLINNANSDVQNTLKSMERLEYEKAQEKLQMNSVVPAPDGTGLLLDVTNVGAKVIRVRYLGSINSDGTIPYAQYSFVDVGELAAGDSSIKEYLDPGISALYYLPITPFSGWGTYYLKVISEMGGIYTILYRGGELHSTPSITLNKSSGEVGESVLLSGTNFSSGTSVLVYFDDTQVATATTYENGSFSASFQIPASSPEDPHTVRVVGGSLVDEKSFTINPP